MDQSTLVEDEIVDGRRFLERFAADGNPISAAAWLKVEEDNLWFLYVATELYDLEGPTAAYRAAHAALDKLGDHFISGPQITLISPGNPIAQGLRNIASRHPKRPGFPLRFERLGSTVVERAYVYSPRLFESIQPGSMTIDDVSQEILRLLMRGPGVRQRSRVVLKDGTDFEGVPLTLHSGDHDSMTVQFLAEPEHLPRVYPISQIASIG